jgi:hypothetical protein
MMQWAGACLGGFKTKGAEYVTMIINCHGYEFERKDYKGRTTSHGGFGLKIGTGIRTEEDVKAFRHVMPHVDYIILTVCKAAAITNPGSTWNGDGNLFCGAIAKKALSVVYASTATQRTSEHTGVGKIDALNGTWIRYSEDGSCRHHGNFPNDFW